MEPERRGCEMNSRIFVAAVAVPLSGESVKEKYVKELAK